MKEYNISQKVYRSEEKYFINYQDYLYLKSIFNVILDKDIYNIKNNNQDYWIRSLYFDTLYNKDYNEKILGIKNRKKIRLRIYDTDDKSVKLEIKNRYEEHTFKESVIISRQDAISLINGSIEILLKYDDVAKKVYYFMQQEYYKPNVVVDYEREAYTYPINNIRITFDKKVRGSKDVYNLFEKDICQTNVFEEDIMVLEVKYNQMLPKIIRDVLGTCNGQRSSISKYCLVKNIVD